MRDPLWKESGRRPLDEGILSRAPRDGLTALCFGAVSAVLVDLMILVFFAANLYVDIGSQSGSGWMMIWIWLGVLYILSFAAFVLSIVFARRGSRSGDRGAFWAILLGQFLLGAFVVLVIPRLLRSLGYKSQTPDELRARYSLVLNIKLAFVHSLVWLLIVMLLIVPR